MKSVLRYIGKKDIDLEKYEIHKSKIYVEPFGGSFNTGFKLIEQGYKGRLIYNDLDKNVYNFWIQVRDNVERLTNYIENLDYIINKLSSPVEKERIIFEWSIDPDDIKKAASEYIYRHYLTMNGLSFVRAVDPFIKLDLVLSSELLKRIEIYNREATNIIQAFDSTVTFMLVDPPYKMKEVDKYYRCNSSEFKHRELEKILRDSKSKWLLTYNNDDYIDLLYDKYNKEIVSRDMFGRQYKELYIKNF